MIKNADSCGNLGHPRLYLKRGEIVQPTVRCCTITHDEFRSAVVPAGYTRCNARSYCGCNEYGAYSHQEYVHNSALTTKEIAAQQIDAAEYAGEHAGRFDGALQYLNGNELADRQEFYNYRCMLGDNVLGCTLQSAAGIRSYIEAFERGYLRGFEKGRTDGFIALIKRAAPQGYNSLFFYSPFGGFYLMPNRCVRYVDNNLYELIGGCWHSLGPGRLCSVCDGEVSHWLPNGTYYTSRGVNHVLTKGAAHIHKL